MTNAIEAVAEVWASIDGKLDEFRAGGDHGHREGYLEEAREMIERLAKRLFFVLHADVDLLQANQELIAERDRLQADDALAWGAYNSALSQISATEAEIERLRDEGLSLAARCAVLEVLAQELEASNNRLLIENGLLRWQNNTLNRIFHRVRRFLQRRDNCQVCDGTRGVRGNEQRVEGVIMCDYCHAARIEIRR